MATNLWRAVASDKVQVLRSRQNAYHPFRVTGVLSLRSAGNKATLHGSTTGYPIDLLLTKLEATKCTE